MSTIKENYSDGKLFSVSIGEQIITSRNDFRNYIEGLIKVLNEDLLENKFDLVYRQMTPEEKEEALKEQKKYEEIVKAEQVKTEEMKKENDL